MADCKSKILSYLSFARRCGGVAFGTEQTLAQIRKSKGVGVCVMLASDASERTKKQIRDKCSFYGAYLADSIASSGEMSKCIGKASAVMVLAVTDKKLAAAIKEQMRTITDSEAE